MGDAYVPGTAAHGEVLGVCALWCGGVHPIAAHDASERVARAVAVRGASPVSLRCGTCLAPLTRRGVSPSAVAVRSVSRLPDAAERVARAVVVAQRVGRPVAVAHGVARPVAVRSIPQQGRALQAGSGPHRRCARLRCATWQTSLRPPTLAT